jgi:Sugar phosphate isomerases/epimerases
MKIAGHTMGTPQMTVREAADLFAHSGMDAIEIIYQPGYKCGYGPGTTDQQLMDDKAFFDKIGLEVSGIVSYASDYNQPDEQRRSEAVNDCRRCIGIARILSAKFIRIYGGTFLDGDTEFELKRGILVSTMRSLAQEAAKAGVSLIIENHFNTMTTGPRITMDIVSEIGMDNVGILYDQANIGFLSGENYKECIEIQKDKIMYVHVKDFAFKKPGMKFTAGSVTHVNEEERAVISKVVGEGILPWPDILTDLKRIGYDGYLSLEYEYRWHPMDLPSPETGMAKSAAYLRALLRQQ